MSSAALIGERTGGSTGQPLPIELPCGAQARLCTKTDIYPDGRQCVWVGLIPDLEVHPTAADLTAGCDAVLEAAQRMLCSRQALLPASVCLDAGLQSAALA